MKFSVRPPSPPNTYLTKVKLRVLFEFSERRKINPQKVPIVSGGLSESNTVNNMKLMILAKIRVIHIYVPPAHACAASVFGQRLMCAHLCVIET